jgi:hypothetical protein
MDRLFTNKMMGVTGGVPGIAEIMGHPGKY